MCSRLINNFAENILNCYENTLYCRYRNNVLKFLLGKCQITNHRNNK